MIKSLINKELLSSNYFKLFFFLPILLATGPFFPDLAVSLSLLIFLMHYKKINFKLFLEGNYIFFSFLLFFIWINLSALFSVDVLFSLKSSLPYLRFLIFIIITNHLFHSIKQQNSKNYIYIVIILISFIILDGFKQFFTGTNFFGFEKPSDLRLSGIFDDKMILGSYLSKIYPLVLFFSFFYNLFKIRSYLFLFSLFSILIFCLIILSGERASSFHFILFNFILIICLNAKLKKYIYLSFFVTLPFLILLIFHFKPNIQHRMITTVIDSFSEKKLFSRYHHEHYNSAYKIFLDHKILGTGPNTFRIVCDKPEYRTSKRNLEKSIFNCSTHPHNTYLQLLSETGFVGFLFIFFIFLQSCFVILKHIYLKFFEKNFLKNHEIVVHAAILFYLFPFSSNGNFFNNWLSIYLAIYLSLLFFKKKIN